MSEIIVFEYVVFAFFALTIFKSTLNGGTCESVSILSSLLGLIFAAIFYSDCPRDLIIASCIFLAFYTIGTYIGMKNRRTGIFEKITGFVVGILKAALFLVLIITISLKFEFAPPQFAKSWIITFLMPYAKSLEEFSKTKLVSKR